MKLPTLRTPIGFVGFHAAFLLGACIKSSADTRHVNMLSRHMPEIAYTPANFAAWDGWTKAYAVVMLIAAAFEAAETAEYRRRVEREYLAIRYVTLTRTPMDAPGRDAAVDAFITDIKSHGITEIMERTSLTVSREAMKRSFCANDRTGRYTLYYIMQ